MIDLVDRLTEYNKDWRTRAGSATEVNDAIAEIKQLRINVEYWRLAAERRDARRELTGLDVAEARTLDAPGEDPVAPANRE